jgi:uncharacterized membrane protein YeaQ/YmgE (transglycosylase-associated protein family)
MQITEIKTFQEFFENDKKIEDLSNLILEKIDNNEIDEGLFATIIGGTAGVLVGPAIGRAIAKALGVQEGGILWNLLISKAVTAVIGATIANSTKK